MGLILHSPPANIYLFLDQGGSSMSLIGTGLHVGSHFFLWGVTSIGAQDIILPLISRITAGRLGTRRGAIGQTHVGYMPG